MTHVRRLRLWVVSFAAQDASAVALINMLLACVAFVKDLLQAVYFGTSPTADALTLAFFVPDTLGNNLLACALGAACVPLFCKLLVEGEWERLRRVFLQVTVYALLLVAGGCLLIYCFPDAVLKHLGSGLLPDVYAQCKTLLLLLLPTMVLFPLWMIGSAALQAMGVFKPASWAPVVFNACGAASLVALCLLHVEQERGGWWASAGLIAGVVGEVVLVAVAFWKHGGRAWIGSWQSIGGSHDDLKRVVRTFAPYLLILLFSQLVYTVERGVASTLGSGTIAALNYAFRLASMPNWVFVAALTTVLLPSLARAIGERDERKVRAAWNRAITATLLLTVPMAAGLCLLRVPIVGLLFQHGSFDEQSLQTTASILAGYSLSIVPLALTAVGVRYYMAVERMRVPTLLALVSFAVNVAFDVLFAPKIGSAALGYGAAVGAFVGAAAMMGFVYREFLNLGEMGEVDGTLSDHHTSVQ